MKDGIIKGQGNSRLLRGHSSIPTTYADFRSALLAGTLLVDLLYNAGGWDVEGTPLNKANLLTNAVATALDLASEDPTVNEAISALITLATPINNLTTTVAGHSLDAVQGKALNDLINALSGVVSGKVDTTVFNTNNAIVQRDLLRIKMRQTGLNLDPNAWSDTLEDISGINMGASSGFTISGGEISLDTGLTQLTGANNRVVGTEAGTDYHLGQTFTATAGFNGRTQIQVTFKTSTRQGTQPAGVVNVYATSGGLPTGSPIGSVSYARNALAVGAEVSFTINLSTALVYNQVYAITLESTENLGGTNNLYFLASATSTYSGGARIARVAAGAWSTSTEDMYFKIDPMWTSATVVWNAVTSIGTLTSAIVESIANLGTGTITYYISRNGGTTFTACTLDALTSISGQTTGTSVVLKVVITGNAKLLAVAWGGVV